VIGYDCYTSIKKVKNFPSVWFLVDLPAGSFKTFWSNFHDIFGKGIGLCSFQVFGGTRYGRAFLFFRHEKIIHNMNAETVFHLYLSADLNKDAPAQTR